MNTFTLIADAATQPTIWEVWSPARVIEVVAAVVAGVLSIIAVLKNRENTARLNRQNERQERLDSEQKTIALHTPAPNRPPSPLLLLPLLILPFFLGCALFSTKSASEDKVAALEQTFASTVTALTQLRHDGKLSDTDWARTKEIAEGIDAAFDALHDDLDAGRKVDVDVVLNGIRASLQRLSTYRSEATRAVSDASAPARSSGLARNLGQERVQRRAA